MNTRSIWSLLLLAATLTTGSCSKENEEVPSLKFELSTGSDAGTESPSIRRSRQNGRDDICR